MVPFSHSNLTASEENCSGEFVGESLRTTRHLWEPLWAQGLGKADPGAEREADRRGKRASIWGLPSLTFIL